MGFSTSGSLLVIFFGLFIALGSMYTATSNATDRVTEGYGDQHQLQTEIHNTEITVADATWHANTTEDNLTIRVDNEGSTTLSVNATDVFLDGEYWASEEFEIATVDGNETDIWGLAEQLRLENTTTQPEQVKVVTGVGVAATARVTTAGIEWTTYAVSKDYNNNDTNSGVEFNVTNTYDGNVTLLDVTVSSTDTTATYINYTKDATPSEVRVALEPTLETPATTADGNFTVGETITTDSSVVLEPDQVAQYKIGEFRNSNGEVAMTTTEVTVQITYEDPYGVERTWNRTMGVDN